MADVGLGGMLQIPDLVNAVHGQSIAEFLSSTGMEYPPQGEGQIMSCNNDKQQASIPLFSLPY